MALVTLQTIFQDAFPAYEQRHALPAHVRRAAHALMQCRTAALGGHIQACPDGHVSRVWYNSCRHRSCPQCAYLQTERWLARQRARLLACDHYHVIFTLPHDLNPLWLAHGQVMTTLLFQAVRDTLGTLLDVHFVNPSPVLHLDKAGDCGHHQRMKMSVLPDSRQGPLPCQYLMLPQ